MDLQVVLNNYASEIFRKQADFDYVSARANFRMQLRQQFLWSAQQAVEKYLKAILLYNGRSARYPLPLKKEFGHDLIALLTAVRTIPIFAFDLLPENERFITYLSQQGTNRYLSRSAYNSGEALHQLDSTVWHIRRHCQYMADRGLGSRAAVPGMREAVVRAALNPSHQRRPHAFKLFAGELEKIIARSPNDPARKALVWGNLQYGARMRTRATYRTFSSSEVSIRDRNWQGVDWSQIDDYVKP